MLPQSTQGDLTPQGSLPDPQYPQYSHLTAAPGTPSGGGLGKLVSQTRLPHPFLHPRPQKGVFLSPGGERALQVTLRHSGREQRGDALALPGGSLGVQQAEINPNDPVFPGDVSQSESAPMRPPFPLSAA